MSASSFLDRLAGVAAVVLGGEDGQLLDAAGAAAQPDMVASATSEIARGLVQLGAALRFDSSDPFTFTIKGNASAHVVCRQRGAIAVVEVDPKRATGDLEVKLRDLDAWAAVEPILAEGSAPQAVEPQAPAPPVEPAAPLADTRRPRFTGDLHLFGLPDLLEFLRAGGRTGTLVCTSERGSGTVNLRQGKIVGASSPGATSLAAFFAQRGVFTPSEARTLAAHPADFSDAVVARVLLERGAVRVEDVRDARLGGIVSAIRELMTWTSGRFAFDTSTSGESMLPAVDVEIDSQALLLSIFANEDERARAR